MTAQQLREALNDPQVRQMTAGQFAKHIKFKKENR